MTTDKRDRLLSSKDRIITVLATLGVVFLLMIVFLFNMILRSDASYTPQRETQRIGGEQQTSEEDPGSANAATSADQQTAGPGGTSQGDPAGAGDPLTANNGSGGGAGSGVANSGGSGSGGSGSSGSGANNGGNANSGGSSGSGANSGSGGSGSGGSDSSGGNNGGSSGNGSDGSSGSGANSGSGGSGSGGSGSSGANSGNNGGSSGSGANGGNASNGGSPAAKTQPAPTQPPTTKAAGNGGIISSQKAKQIALKHAGLSESQVTMSKLKHEWDDGIQIYDVEFYYGDYEYEYEIDARNGEILECDIDD